VQTLAAEALCLDLQGEDMQGAHVAQPSSQPAVESLRQTEKGRPKRGRPFSCPGLVESLALGSPSEGPALSKVVGGESCRASRVLSYLGNATAVAYLKSSELIINPIS
jgi:hypothetical protein